MKGLFKRIIPDFIEKELHRLRWYNPSSLGNS